VFCQLLVTRCGICLLSFMIIKTLYFRSKCFDSRKPSNIYHPPPSTSGSKPTSSNFLDDLKRHKERHQERHHERHQGRSSSKTGRQSIHKSDFRSDLEDIRSNVRPVSEGIRSTFVPRASAEAENVPRFPQLVFSQEPTRFLTEVKMTNSFHDSNSLTGTASADIPEIKTEIKVEPVFDAEPILIPDVEVKKEREEPLEEGECTSDDD
jgi:hypothetical protein